MSELINKEERNEIRKMVGHVNPSNGLLAVSVGNETLCLLLDTTDHWEKECAEHKAATASMGTQLINLSRDLEAEISVRDQRVAKALCERDAAYDSITHLAVARDAARAETKAAEARIEELEYENTDLRCARMYKEADYQRELNAIDRYRVAEARIAELEDTVRVGNENINAEIGRGGECTMKLNAAEERIFELEKELQAARNAHAYAQDQRKDAEARIAKLEANQIKSRDEHYRREERAIADGAAAEERISHLENIIRIGNDNLAFEAERSDERMTACKVAEARVIELERGHDALQVESDDYFTRWEAAEARIEQLEREKENIRSRADAAQESSIKSNNAIDATRAKAEIGIDQIRAESAEKIAKLTSDIESIASVAMTAQNYGILTASEAIAIAARPPVTTPKEGWLENNLKDPQFKAAYDATCSECCMAPCICQTVKDANKWASKVVCRVMSRTVGPCDLPRGHEGLHSNNGDGFSVPLVAKPVCSHCNDTGKIVARSGFGAMVGGFEECPNCEPCAKRSDGSFPRHCATTPCVCECHKEETNLAPVTCLTCNDTHKQPAENCHDCPDPCGKCCDSDMRYCKVTPCPCTCHMSVTEARLHAAGKALLKKHADELRDRDNKIADLKLNLRLIREFETATIHDLRAESEQRAARIAELETEVKRMQKVVRQCNDAGAEEHERQKADAARIAELESELSIVRDGAGQAGADAKLLEAERGKAQERIAELEDEKREAVQYAEMLKRDLKWESDASTSLAKDRDQARALVRDAVEERKTAEARAEQLTAVVAARDAHVKLLTAQLVKLRNIFADQSGDWIQRANCVVEVALTSNAPEPVAPSATSPVTCSTCVKLTQDLDEEKRINDELINKYCSPTGFPAHVDAAVDEILSKKERTMSPVTCAICNDTHRVPLEDSTHAGSARCRFCPDKKSSLMEEMAKVSAAVDAWPEETKQLRQLSSDAEAYFRDVVTLSEEPFVVDPKLAKEVAADVKQAAQEYGTYQALCDLQLPKATCDLSYGHVGDMHENQYGRFSLGYGYLAKEHERRQKEIAEVRQRQFDEQGKFQAVPLCECIGKALQCADCWRKSDPPHPIDRALAPLLLLVLRDARLVARDGGGLAQAIRDYDKAAAAIAERGK